MEQYTEVEITDKIKKRIPAYLWYKYFYVREILPEHNAVILPQFNVVILPKIKIKRKFI